jgi:hypothetical protein
MTTRVTRRVSRRSVGCRGETLSRLDKGRQSLIDSYKEMGLVNTRPWFASTDRGWRHFVFPALPDAIPDNIKIPLCEQWLKRELVSRGMLCILTLFRTGPIFSCSIREANKRGFGRVVPEWDTDAFLDIVRASFTVAVNDELQRRGLPGDFQ